MNSQFTRVRVCRANDDLEVPESIPVSYFLEASEDGTEVPVRRDPVAPSLAEDFSISANALLRRGSAPVFRSSADIVDFERSLLDY